MTEAEWLACTDPQPMLKFLRGKASDRKSRLFGFACCQGIQGCLTSRSLTALDTVKRYADGLSSTSELVQASYDANEASQKCGGRDLRVRGRSHCFATSR